MTSATLGARRRHITMSHSRSQGKKGDTSAGNVRCLYFEKIEMYNQNHKKNKVIPKLFNDLDK